jgi:hypothetical protein
MSSNRHSRISPSARPAGRSLPSRFRPATSPQPCSPKLFAIAGGHGRDSRARRPHPGGLLRSQRRKDRSPNIRTSPDGRYPSTGAAPSCKALRQNRPQCGRQLPSVRLRGGQCQATQPTPLAQAREGTAASRRHCRHGRYPWRHRIDRATTCAGTLLCGRRRPAPADR